MTKKSYYDEFDYDDEQEAEIRRFKKDKDIEKRKKWDKEDYYSDGDRDYGFDDSR